MRSYIAIICTLACCFVAQIGYSEVIVRRDGLPTIKGTILSGGETGLLFKEDSNPTSSSRIPWSTIVSIESGESRPRLQQFIELGEQLWRAKHRLLRGDIQLSEPIFISQFNRLSGTDGEDTRLAAEGLLRILVARGSLRRALHPWLETVRLQEIGFESPFTSLQPILDEKTMLCPHLPVFEIGQSDLPILKTYTSAKYPIASSLAVVLSADYLNSSTVIPVLHVQDQLFLSQLLNASVGEAKDRETLENRLVGLQPWQQAWAHYALALGCLQSKSKEVQNKGLIHLAIVASQDPSLQPWLSGSSMLRLSTALSEDGRVQQSDRILHEATRLFPSHPMVIDVKEMKRNTNQ